MDLRITAAEVQAVQVRGQARVGQRRKRHPLDARPAPAIPGCRHNRNGTPRRGRCPGGRSPGRGRLARWPRGTGSIAGKCLSAGDSAADCPRSVPAPACRHVEVLPAGVGQLIEDRRPQVRLRRRSPGPSAGWATSAATRGHACPPAAAAAAAASDSASQAAMPRRAALVGDHARHAHARLEAGQNPGPWPPGCGPPRAR